MSLVDDTLRYSNLFGPSGAEDEVIAAFKADLEGLGLEPEVDRLGNVGAVLCEARPGFPTVMVSAHLDEIGFVVRKIDEDGFLRLHRVGGVHDRVIAGQTLVFATRQGRVEGAVGVKAKHVSSPEELKTSVGVDDCYVDVLAGGREDAEARGFEVGTLGTFKAAAVRSGDFVRGKALDDRACVAVLLDVARRLIADPPEAGVVLLGTIQEEFSVRGGVPAARRIAPDLIVCLDIGIATDTPDLRDLGDVKLGAGAVITRFTRASLAGIIPNPKLLDHFAGTARRHAIPLQYAVLQGGLTDGSFMQLEAGGIPTIDVGFAVRYTHTPIETAHVGDMQAAGSLVAEALRAIPRDFDLGRG